MFSELIRKCLLGEWKFLIGILERIINLDEYFAVLFNLKRNLDSFVAYL